jgi:hypothetical protein
MDAEQIARHFTRRDGSYAFARWGRPLAPVVFGVEPRTLGVVKGAIAAVADLAGREVVETDPELGANLMVFFFRDWAELPAVPNLDKMVEGLGPLCARLGREGAARYRMFRFDEAGAVRAAFVFVRMDAASQAMPADVLALGEAVQAILPWSDAAFAEASPLGRVPGGRVVLKPQVADLIRAAYDPVMPDAADDPAHALRLAARMGAGR